MNRKFRNFNEARTFVRKLDLKNQIEWIQYSKSGNKPLDIPTAPWQYYKKWIGLSDWLGTKNIAGNLMKFKSFTSARDFVRKLKFKNQKEWRNYCKSGNKPDDIPSNPSGTYKKEWKSFGDWLGTGTIADRNLIFREFESARKFAHSLNLKNQREWQAYSKSGNKPNDLPSTPSRHYKKEWKGWGNFLGTGNIANQISSKNYLTFIDAKIESRKLAIKYKIRNWNDWKKAVKEGKIPKNIPLQPDRVYSKKRKK